MSMVSRVFSPSATETSPAAPSSGLARERVHLTPTQPWDSQESLERLTRLSARAFRAPCAAIYLAPQGRQLLACDFPEVVGIERDRLGERDIDVLRRPAEAGRAILVGDRAGEPNRSKENAGELTEFRSYLGVPLERSGGVVVGAFCVLDVVPRAWSVDEVHLLKEFAAAALADLESRIEDAARRESLAVAEARYRRLAENSPYGIYAVDAEGRITELNAAAGIMLGVDPGEVLGRQFTDFVAPEDITAARESFLAQLSGRVGARDTELQVVAASGERLIVQIRSAPIRVADGVVGVHGVARDVTDERARDAQLRRAERLAYLSTLLSGVTHELNNPLTSIKSFSQLMLLDDRSPDDVESLEVIHREAERAAKIVTDLRLITRQSCGEDGDRMVFDLNETVRSVIDLVRFSVQSAGIDLREDLTRDALRVYGHREQLEQMILNLVLNAEHAVREMHADRRVIIRTRQSRRGIALAVIDSGRGIPPDHLDRIFDPFWTTRSPGQGTGLGLSVVNSIVKEHGGEIRVESEIGKGSAFTVDLPWPLPGAMPLSEGRAERGAAARLRILIVDDEAPIRLSLARFLERRGHDVADAHDGRRALELLEGEGSFDLIVSDLRMHGMGGEQFFQQMVARGDGSERRVVFITGGTTGSDADRFLRGSGVPVILKPFALAEVAETLERHAEHLLGDPSVRLR